MRKSRMAAFAGVTAAAMLVGTLSAAPALATNEINFAECNNPVWVDDYFIIGVTGSNGTGFRRCFANAGDLTIGQDGVTSFNSGNNAGFFEYEPGDGSRYRHTFNKGETITKNYGYIDNLHIN